MKIRAKTEVKLTNGKTNLTFTFPKDTELFDAIKTLLVVNKHNPTFIEQVKAECERLLVED